MQMFLHERVKRLNQSQFDSCTEFRTHSFLTSSMEGPEKVKAEASLAKNPRGRVDLTWGRIGVEKEGLST